MVQVRDAYPLNEQQQVDIPRWVDRLQLPAGNDVELADCKTHLIKAAEFALAHQNQSSDKVHFWGEDYSSFLTGLEMAEILTDLHLDTNTLCAAIIYRAVRGGAASLEKVEHHFSPVVKDLVDGVLKMAQVASTEAYLDKEKVLGSSQGQPDHIRKMLVAMVDDVRVALIKLAERTCAIRAVKDTPERRHKVAKEVFEIYAPLAHRLGIGHIKWELEDLSFRYLEPDAYKRIASLLDERRLDRQGFIDNVSQTLRQELSDAHIEGDVFGRAKHIYSIWRKMQRKRIEFSEVYDIRAVRILVKNLRDCYSVLGIVHTLWKAIPNEFDDYIALPKENGYRSLHTAVIGPDAKILEIQIRTFDMHSEAEFGVCAHWQYKGADGATNNDGYEDKIAWLKRVLDEQESDDLPNLADELAQDITEDRIYVFTPNGHVVELSHGATPLDFAYRVHTEIGHRCRGAKINGRIVPLTYALENGQQVEILTAKEPEPSREWMRPSLGYLKTTRARAKVRTWFKQRDRSKNIITGRALLEREFKRLSLTSLDYKAVADAMNYTSVDAMYAATGSGDLSISQTLREAQKIAENSDAQYELSPAWLESKVTTAEKTTRKESSNDVYVSGVGSMMTQMANCCKPLPGDMIGGYVTVGRGVSVHRQDCSQFLILQEQEPERIIEVGFASRSVETYPVDVAIEAYDRPGLLGDITVLLASEKVNVLAVQSFTDRSSNIAAIKLTIQVKGIDYLGLILGKINQLPNVIDVSRVIDKRML